MKTRNRFLRGLGGLAILALPTLLGDAASNPKLSVVATGPQQYLASWPAFLSQSFRLEATTDLATGTWTAVPDAPVTNGALFQVAVNSAAPKLFFRLRCDCDKGANDIPDGLFADVDCDGFDGTLTKAVFVSVTGTDDPARGLTPDQPVRTVQFGVDLAASAGRTQVCITAGTYNESVIMKNGVSIYGGYDANWIRAPRTDPSHAVTIQGSLTTIPGLGQSQDLTVLAQGLSTPVEIADVIVRGPNATTSGRGSYGVVALNATLTLARVTVQAGNGAGGTGGGSGASASPADATTAMNGGTGAPAGHTSGCDSTTRAIGGSGGTNTSATGTSGGTGGSGGLQDGSCSGFPPSGTATAGSAGANAAVSGAAGGTGGSGGPANSSSVSGGADGRPATNGAAGSGGSGAVVLNSFILTVPGGNGGVGNFGGGGGGGGGSGGNDSGNNTYGAGGGGGGAGGAAAPGSATGGTGGGASVGLYAFSATVTATDCVFQRGVGGNGGNGGAGGRGQSGGAGGSGGAASSNSPAGGRGGNGAHGGHGGGGGGGAGGLSAGIVLRNSTLTSSAGSTFIGGAAGLGGSGGLSAPSAPVAERDGNDGAAGQAGTVGTIVNL